MGQFFQTIWQRSQSSSWPEHLFKQYGLTVGTDIRALGLMNHRKSYPSLFLRTSCMVQLERGTCAWHTRVLAHQYCAHEVLRQLTENPLVHSSPGIPHLFNSFIREKVTGPQIVMFDARLQVVRVVLHSHHQVSDLMPSADRLEGGRFLVSHAQACPCSSPPPLHQRDHNSTNIWAPDDVLRLLEARWLYSCEFSICCAGRWTTSGPMLAIWHAHDSQRRPEVPSPDP